MIIGISGKIGSGKDTIGKIVQYWTFCKTGYAGARGSITDCANYLTSKYYKADHITVANVSGWQVKKFAGKLKQTVSLLTGIPIEDLEKQEIKDTLLDDSWQVYELYNFGQAVGKTKGIQRVITSFSTEREAQYFCDEKTNSQHQFTYKKTERTVRWLLQTVGTDAMRDVIHPNIWVNALFADYKSIFIGEHEGTPEHDEYIYPNWIITDVRFPNELQAIKDRGGITIRVNRPNINKLIDSGINVQGTNEHPSETALDNAVFDHVIDNNGTIEELVEKVKEILEKHSII